MLSELPEERSNCSFSAAWGNSEKRDLSSWPFEEAAAAHLVNHRFSCSSSDIDVLANIQHVIIFLGLALVNTSTYSMQSAQLIAGTSTGYSSTLGSDKVRALDTERRWSFNATAVHPLSPQISQVLHGQALELATKRRGFGLSQCSPGMDNSQAVRAQIVLVTVMQRKSGL